MNGLYAAVIDARVAVKVGPNAWTPAGAGLSGTWNQVASGTNYTVWELANSVTFSPTPTTVATPAASLRWWRASTAAGLPSPTAAAMPGPLTTVFPVDR